MNIKLKRKQNIIETLKIEVKNKIENEGKIKGNRTKDKGNKEDIYIVYDINNCEGGSATSNPLH